MTETGYARILLDKKDTQIMELESEITKLRIEYERLIMELQKENAELKILVSSMLYEINDLWDISEMNEDVRKHAEKIDSEVEK